MITTINELKKIYESKNLLNKIKFIYKIKFEFFIEFTGELYDGSTLSEGVPYCNGIIDIFVNDKKLNIKDNTYNNGNHELAEIFDHYINYLKPYFSKKITDLSDYYYDGYEMSPIIEYATGVKSVDGTVYPMKSLEFYISNNDTLKYKTSKFLSAKQYNNIISDYETQSDDDDDYDDDYDD